MLNELVENTKQQIQHIVSPLLEQDGYEFVELEYRRENTGWVVRLFVDKDGGITIDDCTHISRRVGDVLEVKDIIPTAYTLEISSPGLDRPLKSENDFKRAIDNRVAVLTTETLDGKNSFNGLLTRVDRGVIYLECNGGSYQIPLKKIVKARFDIQF